jgi:hypothetical protein
MGAIYPWNTGMATASLPRPLTVRRSFHSAWRRRCQSHGSPWRREKFYGGLDAFSGQLYNYRQSAAWLCYVRSHLFFFNSVEPEGV